MLLRGPLFLLSSAIRRSGSRLVEFHPSRALDRCLLFANMSFSSLAATAAEELGLEDILMTFQRQGNLPDVVLARGSVVTFRSANGAIVNAANEGCLGGGGVDGAISAAGGEDLYYARVRLPIIRDGDDRKSKSLSPIEYSSETNDNEQRSVKDNDITLQSASDDDDDDDDDNDDDDSNDSNDRIRCRTGEAVITGPARFGKLQVPYVIHAVGPNFWSFHDRELAYEKLESAYRSSLDLAEAYKIEDVAFCLLSAGVYRGNEKILHVVGSGLEAIAEWRPKSPLVSESTPSLSTDSSPGSNSEMNLQHTVYPRRIYVCAFTERECKMLVACAQKVFAYDGTVKLSTEPKSFML